MQKQQTEFCCVPWEGLCPKVDCNGLMKLFCIKFLENLILPPGVTMLRHLRAKLHWSDTTIKYSFLWSELGYWSNFSLEVLWTKDWKYASLVSFMSYVNVGRACHLPIGNSSAPLIIKKQTSFYFQMIKRKSQHFCKIYIWVFSEILEYVIFDVNKKGHFIKTGSVANASKLLPEALRTSQKGT